MLEREDIVKQLKKVYDSKLPLDVWNMGMIYNIDLEERKKGGYNVNLDVAMPEAICGMGCCGTFMPMNIQYTIAAALKEVKKVNINLIAEPPWHESMISSEGKQRLALTYPALEHLVDN